MESETIVEKKCNLIDVVGKNAKAARKKLNITQEELAFRMDSHREAISRIEKGKVNISLRILERLASALNVKVCELVKEIK